jgi:uncharacterized membrane protein
MTGIVNINIKISKKYKIIKATDIYGIQIRKKSIKNRTYRARRTIKKAQINFKIIIEYRKSKNFKGMGRGKHN